LEDEIYNVSNINNILLNTSYEKQNLMMTRSRIPKIDINGIYEYDYQENQCVYGALYYMYNFDKEYLFNIFNNYIKINNLKNTEPYKNFNMDSGVSSNQILYLCQIKDISVYGLDWKEKLFIKNISKNRNYKTFCYILNNAHCYLITDEKIIKSISMKKRNIKTNLHTSLFIN
jgi:hypothetical protein